jgi:hypothetical protein
VRARRRDERVEADRRLALARERLQAVPVALGRQRAHLARRAGVGGRRAGARRKRAARRRRRARLEVPEAAVGDAEVGAHARRGAAIAQPDALPQRGRQRQAQEAGVPGLGLQVGLQAAQPRPLARGARLEAVLARLRARAPA